MMNAYGLVMIISGDNECMNEKKGKWPSMMLKEQAGCLMQPKVL